MNTDIPLDNLNSGIFNFNISPVIIFFLLVLFLILILYIAFKTIRHYAYKSRYFKNIIFLIRLPKEKPGEENKEPNLQQLREEIALGEILFASVGGLRAQRGFWPVLFGRNDHFSFEIVSHKKIISFYVIAPYAMGRYIEQIVHSHYPDASIEKVDDYNVFTPQSSVVGGYLKTKRHFVFPIKTYNKMETDPLNSIVNVMSKLEADEGMALQVIARSAKAAWHRKSAWVARQVHMHGKKISEVVDVNVVDKIFSFFGEIFKAANPSTKKDTAMMQQKDNARYRGQSPMEQEMLKGIEEKNSKAGMDVNIRIIVSARDRGQANLYLNNMASAFNEYNYYTYGNSFNSKANIGVGGIFYSFHRFVYDYIYHHFNENASFLLNAEELNSIFHFPLRHTETPNILWLTANHASAPTNIPEEGIIIGRNVYRGIVKDIRMARADRRRHTYIIGKSGVGKSILQASMAVQDIINGEGVCLIDPHGDLIEDVISRIPPERSEDVIVFSPADIERPLALNLLEFDPRFPEQKTFVINEMIKIFDKLYDLKQTGGPIFEQYMRNAMLLVMADPESGSTLMEIPKVLANPEFRRMKLDRCQDYTVVEFWRKEAEKAGGDAALANVVPYITSKLTSFISNDTMRPIIGQQNSAFNVRDIMDKNKILLVDLTKGLIGELNAHLLGMILVGKILMAALSRANLELSQRKDFYLYIDEFQNFTTDSVCSILSEARKYGLNLIIAHQYINQLIMSGNNTAIKDAVFGNVGTWMTFKIGSEDAQILEKEMSPVFNQFDLINIEKYTAYVKLLIDNTASRPFSMSTLWPIPGEQRPGMSKKIRALSRLKYGQDRSIIESEILRRTKLL